MKCCFIIALMSLFALSPAIAQDWFQDKGYRFTQTTNSEWVTVSGAVTYDNQGYMHSEYLTLLPDGLFVFTRFYEVGRSFAMGYWELVANNKILLNADDSLSEKIIQNEDNWRRYGFRSTPRYLPLEDWAMLKKRNTLITTGFDGNTDSLIRIADAFIQSLDLANCLLITDTIEQYDSAGYVIGHHIRELYYDEQGLPVKYATRGLKQTVINDPYGIYFLPGNIGKVVSYESEKNRICINYFIGQKLISTTKKESAWTEYYNWKSLLWLAKDRYQEDHRPSLRGHFRAKQ